MAIAGSRVGVIGGSLAGCATAVGLRRAGCRVAVYERSGEDLGDRGTGIALPTVLTDELKEKGYLPQGYPSCPLGRRRWLFADGTPGGRTLWDQPGFGADTHNWGVLWKGLRSSIKDDVQYHKGKAYVSHEESESGVTATFSDGSTEEFDVLIGADGYQSKVRRELPWGTEAEYAGYILWRGAYDESRVPDNARAPIDRSDTEKVWQTPVFDKGHSVFYMIPGNDGQTEKGHRRLNWAVYTHVPPEFEFKERLTVAPGDVSPELYACLAEVIDQHIPPEVATLMRFSPREEVFIQPVYDELAVKLNHGRVVLIGDAAAVTRPHTASGATKALQDVLALETLARTATDWNTLCQSFNDERLANANSLVKMGRRFGAAQVEQTPNWGDMSPKEMEQWMNALLSGEKLYFYASADDE